MNMDVLDLEFFSHDLDKTLSFRQYFYELLTTLWEEEEGFSGKRPFGNSCWQFEVYAGFVKHSLIEGTLDEYGYAERYDAKAADALAQQLIKQMCGV